MTIDFGPVWDGMPRLLSGALVTVEVTLAAMAVSAVLGLGVGLVRLEPRRRMAYGLASGYVAFVRGTPLLVQLFILFFGLPQFGILLPATVCGVLGLGLYSASYVSEVVRGAIESIDRGQAEAARSLGMSRAQAMRKVVLPQAFRRMLPPLGNEAIALIKNSALVSLLTIDDVMREGQRIISTSFRALETYVAVALIYFVLTNVANQILRYLERRMQVETRR